MRVNKIIHVTEVAGFLDKQGQWCQKLLHKIGQKLAKICVTLGF